MMVRRSSEKQGTFSDDSLPFQPFANSSSNLSVCRHGAWSLRHSNVGLFAPSCFSCPPSYHVLAILLKPGVFGSYFEIIVRLSIDVMLFPDRLDCGKHWKVP